MAIEFLRRFLRFVIDNIILVVAGVVIGSKVASLYGLSVDYRRTIEELLGLFKQLIAWLW